MEVAEENPEIIEVSNENPDTVHIQPTYPDQDGDRGATKHDSVTSPNPNTGVADQREINKVFEEEEGEEFVVTDLIFRDVTVKIGDATMLQDVSGLGQQGKLLAIIGPSGAGKTTLLNTLSGRQAYVSGEITLKGEKLSRKMRRKICYVLQQDIFFPNLSLMDTLMFTACVRLSDEMSYDQKMKRLDDIIDSLDLRKCLQTPVGGPMFPGLSGGERKRANIACELLTDPSLILLDEPTSGLDSSTALTVMQNLKQYAVSHNKTVVATIHQPSTQLFYQFDNLLLLSNGQPAYFGETRKVVSYFRSINFPVRVGYNPADFILDKMKEDEETRQQIVAACWESRSTDRWPKELRRKRDYHDELESPTMLKDFSDWSPDIKPSSGNSANADEIETVDVRASLMELDVTDSQSTQKFPTSFLTQYKYLTLRTFKESRSRILDKTKILENLTICAFFTLIWFQLPRSEDTLRDRMGAVFFLAIHWGFIPLFDAVSSFPMEQVVIYKERAAGWYRLSAYYLAKMTSELPLTFVQPFIFVVISYWIIGLNGVAAFFATLGLIMVDSLAGQSIGLFLGIINKEMRQAITVGILIEMAIMLLGGLFTRTLPVWLDWLKYLSFLHYSFHCLMYIEFKDGPDIQCSGNINSTIFTACRDLNTTSSVPSHMALEYYGVDWEFWEYFFPLLIFIFLFRILGYLTLRFYHKPT